MTASEQILEYIDGTLDPMEEQQLFTEMASRADLRSELRQLIAIGDAVRSDREAFAPPVEVERALLAGLGLGLIGTGTATAVSASGGFLAALKGALPALASFVVGASIAGGGVYLATRDGDVDRAARTATPVTAPAPVVNRPAAPAASLAASEIVPPAVASPDRASASRGSAPRTAQLAASQPARELAAGSTITDDGVADRTSRLTAPETPAAASTRTDRIVELVVTNDVRSDESPDVASAFAGDHDPMGGSLLPVSALELPSMTGVSVEVRNQALGRAFVDNNAREVAREIADESALALAYRVDHKTWLSLDVGRSRYTQVLMVKAPTDANGGTRYSRVEQEPNITWIGASMMQSFGATVVGTQPFWQWTLGWGLDNGPMVRGRVGLTYDLPLGLALNGAVEASSLVYMYNGQPLVTGKYGLSLGLAFGL